MQEDFVQRATIKAKILKSAPSANMLVDDRTTLRAAVVNATFKATIKPERVIYLSPRLD